MSFNTGDYVRKRHGRRIAVVTSCNGVSMQVRYLHNDNKCYYEYTKDYVKVNKEDYNAKGELIMNAANTTALYEIKDEVTGEKRIGVRLMEKSKTQWIMEIKGSNEVIVAAAANCTEIVPYTIAVKFSDGNTSHYYAEPDQYKKDEMFIMGETLQLARVIGLDSKGKARGDFKPFAKLMVQV